MNGSVHFCEEIRFVMNKHTINVLLVAFMGMIPQGSFSGSKFVVQSTSKNALHCKKLVFNISWLTLTGGVSTVRHDSQLTLSSHLILSDLTVCVC